MAATSIGEPDGTNNGPIDTTVDTLAASATAGNIYLSDTAKEKGLIMGSSPGTGIIRMMPSLIITREQVDEGLKLLEDTIKETAKKFSYPKKG